MPKEYVKPKQKTKRSEMTEEGRIAKKLILASIKTKKQ